MLLYRIRTVDRSLIVCRIADGCVFLRWKNDGGSDLWFWYYCTVMHDSNHDGRFWSFPVPNGWLATQIFDKCASRLSQSVRSSFLHTKLHNRYFDQEQQNHEWEKWCQNIHETHPVLKLSISHWNTLYPNSQNEETNAPSGCSVLSSVTESSPY